MAVHIYSTGHEEGLDFCRNKIWKAVIPPKIKNFVWRVARNIVPTRVCLQNRSILIIRNVIGVERIRMSIMFFYIVR